MKNGETVVGCVTGILVLVALSSLLFFIPAIFLIWQGDINEMRVIAISSILTGFWVSLATGFYVFHKLWNMIPRDSDKEEPKGEVA